MLWSEGSGLGGELDGFLGWEVDSVSLSTTVALFLLAGVLSLFSDAIEIWIRLLALLNNGD